MQLVFACPAGVTARPLAAGCLLAAMPPYGWGVLLAGKRFSASQRFVGADIISARQRNFTNLLFPSAKRDPFSVLLVAACPAGDCFSACPAGAIGRPLETARALRVLCRLTDGAGKTVFSFVGKWCVLSCSCFLLAQQGPKPLFLLLAKEKAVLDSEKEKVDQWKSWGGAVQQDRGPVLICCSSGERL